jgi:hypothetical protein
MSANRETYSLYISLSIDNFRLGISGRSENRWQYAVKNNGAQFLWIGHVSQFAERNFEINRVSE